MTKDQSESLTLETEMDDVKLCDVEKKSSVHCSQLKQTTTNGNDSQPSSPDSKKSPKSSTEVIELIVKNHEKEFDSKEEKMNNKDEKKIVNPEDEENLDSGEDENINLKIDKDEDSNEEVKKDEIFVEENVKLHQEMKIDENSVKNEENFEKIDENSDKIDENSDKNDKNSDKGEKLQVVENHQEEVKHNENYQQEVKNENIKQEVEIKESSGNKPIEDGSNGSAPITSVNDKNPPIEKTSLVNSPNTNENQEKNSPIKEPPVSIENTPEKIIEKSEISPIDSKSNKISTIENSELIIMENFSSKKIENLPLLSDCQVDKKEENIKNESSITIMEKKKIIEDNFNNIEEPKFIVGIVGEPTAVTELINDDELGAESTLPTDDHVAQWVKESANVDNTHFSDPDMDDNDDEDENHESMKETITERKVKRQESTELTSSRKRRQIVNHIIKRSIKCLNKMHAMDENSSVAANTKNMKATEKKEDEDFSRQSPQVPQSQQNGAALPVEEAVIAAAVERLHTTTVKEEPHNDIITDLSNKKSSTTTTTTDLQLMKKQNDDTKLIRQSDERITNRKRRSTEEIPSSNGNTNTKRICLEQREQLVSSLITGYENASADELATRADCLRVELQALDELARAAEMEWNRVLTMRKLKEEAYLRIERRRQVVNFMEGHDRLNDLLPAINLTQHDSDWDKKLTSNVNLREKYSSRNDDDSMVQNIYKNSDKVSKSLQQTAQNLSNRLSADARKHQQQQQQQQTISDVDNRHIGEGRQGPTVDVRSIIADYRLRHPENVPRRGRRMKNSVNVNLGAGGAMMENNQNTDSRPSSTDSCKSNPNIEGNNSPNFKDVLVHFAKLSQQQGEPVKTPQNYPDVTLHPVAPSPTITQTTTPPQPSGSLLHGILTKAQSPRPTTFSPTLARLLTAPERERNTPMTTVTPHSNTTANQRMIQAYQEANPVSISELLSSSKGRTEITITPVVNALVPSHSNNMMQVDDEDESAIMEERESRISGGSRDDREISPRCQGCHERAAQYVCAGCGNQWYCSPECQAAAWDEHSEVCSG